jgi:hypothetical protein
MATNLRSQNETKSLASLSLSPLPYQAITSWLCLSSSLLLFIHRLSEGFLSPRARIVLTALPPLTA